MDSGFLLVDKPEGPTSHGMVALVRRVTGIKKVGHSGTLDPMATGLLVLAIGRSTRLQRYLSSQKKEYQATAKLGVTTTTLDRQGEVIEQSDLSDVTAEQVEQVLEGFRGTIEQIPPMVSALKMGGKRLHEMARSGQVVERPPRTVTLYRLEVTDFQPGRHPRLGLQVEASPGTYIRTLADDIGRALGGVGGHLTQLRRTRVGHLQVADAHPPTDLDPNWDNLLLSPAEGLSHLPSVRLDPKQALAARHGRPLDWPVDQENPSAGPVALVDAQEQLLAVYRVDPPRARAEVVLA